MRRSWPPATGEGDVVWEPFGGLASASVAAIGAGRFACVAEADHDFAEIAAQRLDDAAAGCDPQFPRLPMGASAAPDPDRGAGARTGAGFPHLPRT